MNEKLEQLLMGWRQAIPGAIAGLFLARVGLEATRTPWPASLVLLVGLLATAGGFGLGLGLVRRRVRTWPALALILYILWPLRAPQVAAAVAALAALIWLLGVEQRTLPNWAAPLADGATFVLALAAYAAATAPGLLPADAGEFQLVVPLLGVAHPPGYPLYTMVGHLFVRLVPWGGPAYRLNLMSAPLAAATLVLVARATRLWARKLGATDLMALAGGLAAALALGTATTFWAQATIANIRTPTAFFTALALTALARFATAEETPTADRALVLLALALGLGGTHHQSLAFPAIFFLLYVVLVDPQLVRQPRRWWRPALAGLVGLLPLVYLPIRGAMGAIQAPPNLDTWRGFWNHFLARGFAGDMFAFANATDLPHRLALVPTLTTLQFNPLLLAAALLGLVALIRRDGRLLTLLLGSATLHTFVTITYRAPQTVEYLMPAYLPMAIAMGLLPTLAAQAIPEDREIAPGWPQFDRLATISLTAVVLGAGLLNGSIHGPSFFELAQDTSTRDWVEPLLVEAPADALLLSDYRWSTPLTYLQQVEDQRPDVEVRYVWPVAGEVYRETWQRLVEAALPERPVITTHFYTFPGTTTEPWETGFRIATRPLAEPAAPLAPVDVTFDDQVRVVGYSLRLDRAEPGQVAELTVAWQPVGPPDPAPSFTALLRDATGQPVAQADRALDTDWIEGEVRFERFFLPLYPSLSAGTYQLTLGAYTVVDEGFETLATGGGDEVVPLTALDLTPVDERPFTLQRLAAPFEGGPSLVGIDFDRTIPETLRVYLRWRGPAEAALPARVTTAEGAEAIVTVPPLPAGAYQTSVVNLPGNVEEPLWLSLMGADGEPVMSTGPAGWPVETVRLPSPAPNSRFVPLGNAMAVTEVEAQPVSPGMTMTVDVALVGLHGLTVDASTSVRLTGDDGQWLAAHDSQPAMGAIPTLKWIRGSRVVDRHRLSIPVDFTGDAVRATIVAYERFRLASLVPMDERFPAVPLGEWKLP
jgi:hypothetical protein